MAEPEPEPDSQGPDDDRAVVTGAEPLAGTSPAALAPKCTAAFRKTLLSRLPMLGYLTWKVEDSIQLDEWNAVVSVNADSVLEPLERVVANWQSSDPPPRSKSQ